MRNLRKLLALALSLAMTLSLASFAGATHVDDYTDSDKIAYTEAVDVLSALSVLDGDDTGAFNPKANVTRAEAAAIISRLILTRQIADNVNVTKSRFTDMNGSSWAIKYVDMCADMGIINGVGNNCFNPRGNVTVRQFAKMLLTAIGYGKNNEYVGENWFWNVSLDAQKLGLLEGVNVTNLDAPATREQCAMFAFTALTSIHKVDYISSLDKYVSGFLGSEQPQTIGSEMYNLGRAVASELAPANGDNIYNVGGVKITGDLSASIGRSIRIWFTSDKYGNATAISKAYYSDEVLGTSYEGYSYAEMTNPRKTGFVANAVSNSNMSVYINGSRYDEMGNEYTVANVGGIRGAEVTFVDTGVNGVYDGIADKVFVLEKKVAQLTADPTSRIVGTTTSKYIPGVTESYVDTELVEYEETLKKDDVVLYWTDASGVLRIEKANSFTGNLTGTRAITGGGIGYIINGETYCLSALVGTPALTYTMHDIASAPTASYHNYTYYVDNGGYIVASIPADGEINDYVTIAEIAAVEVQGVESSSYVEALLVDMRGNKKIVRLTSVTVNSNDLNYDGLADSVIRYSGFGSDLDDLLDTSGGAGNYAVNSAVASLVGNTFFTYTETNGVAALSSVYAKTVNRVTTEIGSLTRTAGALNDIQCGKANFAAGLTGNAETKFIVYNVNNNQFAVYEGINKVPNIELVSTSETGYIAVDGFAKYVFIGKNAVDASSAISENSIFLLSAIPVRDYYNTQTSRGYGVYSAIVDGIETTVMIKMSATDVAASGVGYKAVSYDGDYIITLNADTLGMAPQAGYVVSGNTIRLAANATYSYTFAPSTPAFIVDPTRTITTQTTAASLASDENDTVYVVIPSASSFAASFLVVYENDPSATVAITSNPVAATYNVGDEAAPLSVSASAVGSSSIYLSYQWYKNSTLSTTGAQAIAGATSAILSKEFISTDAEGVTYYFAVVSHVRPGMQTSSATSAIVAVTVNGDIDDPVISSISEDTTVAFGATTVPTLSVVVETPTEGTLSYQWYKGDAAISGATSATLDLTSHIDTSVLGENEFSVVVTLSIEGNSQTGSTTSNAIVVTVVPAASTATISGNSLTVTDSINITYAATLSEAVTGTAAYILEWKGASGWTEMSTATQALSSSTDLSAVFEGVFDTDGLYRVRIQITLDGCNPIEDMYSTKLTATP